MQPFFICFTENLNYALGWMVIHSLWQATAIAIISGIAAIAVRKKTPQLRYWIHNTALFAVLIAATITFCLYFDFSKELGETVFIPERVELATKDVIQAANNQAIVTDNTLEAPLSMEGLRMYFNRNIYLIVTVWALGVALFILKLLGGISYVYYLRSKLNFPADEYWLEMVEKLGEKAGVKRTMELVESALVRSPLVVGHLKPMILFPIGAINKLNPQEVEAILAHEIAHVLRNDYLFNIIQSVIEALFYFHPAVWWISANIRTERENCCDDAAIALCGNSMTYAKALVSLQEMAYYGSPNLAMAFAGQRKNQLLFRVQRILKQPHNKTNVMEKLIATCLLLVMMVALSFGGNRWNNNSFAEANALKTTLLDGATNAENAENKSTANAAKHYIKFKVNGVLDSFPVSKDIADGNYNYADNMFQAKLLVKDHAVVKLSINGSEIPAKEIRNHAGFINKIIMRSTAPPQYDDANQFVTEPNSVETTSPSYPEAPLTTPAPSRYPNLAKMPKFSESNGDMVVTNPDGSRTTISHSPNGKIIQTVTTTQPNGSYSTTKTYNNGETISETFDRNGRRITSNTTGSFGTTTRVDNTGDVDSRDDLKEELKDLREEIKDCQCETNTDFRKKLISKIDKTLAALDKGLSENDAKIEFKSIQRTWENGECDDNNTDSNGNIGYSRSNSNYSNGSGGSVGNNRNNNNRYPINTNTNPKSDADHMQLFFLNLVNKGYAQLNREINVAFSNNGLSINGKKMSQDVFNEVKRNFESHLSKPTRYSIAFSGKLSNLTSTGLDISGSLTSSMNDK